MIRLTLLGRLDLVGHDNQSVQSVLQQPKRVALLVYLALGKPGTFQRRDTARAMFWPEADDKLARLALNQTSHFLRQSLDPRVVVNRGREELGIPADVLWCDAVAFGQALKCGDVAEALHLYRGELLPGFYINAGSEFEHWLDDWRSRLQRKAAAGAWQLAESAELGRQYDTAAEWARRAVEVSFDENAVQRLLRLLGRMGDGAGALETYDRFVARLAKEYQAKPSTETKEIVAGIRSGAGQRLRATTEDLAAATFGSTIRMRMPPVSLGVSGTL